MAAREWELIAPHKGDKRYIRRDDKGGLPTGRGWIYELKLGGFRACCRSSTAAGEVNAEVVE